MLGAPDGRLARDDELTLQNARDTPSEGLAAIDAGRRFDEGIAFVAADFADELQHADHGTIVEGDMVIVFFPKREELRPTAISVLGAEDVGQAAIERGAVELILGCSDHARHEAEFVHGPFVVESGQEEGAVSSIRFANGIRILGPATGLGLVGKDNRRDLLGFGGGEPAGRFI